MRRLIISNYIYETKKSNDASVIYAKESAFQIIVYKQTDEVARVLNLIGSDRERIIIHGQRRRVMRIALLLLLLHGQGANKVGIRKLARLLDCFFDFRRLDKPEASLKLESIETELHSLKSEIDGKED